MNPKIKLEIVCGNIESALAAQQGGADRIELCDSLVEGGTTPSYGMIESVKGMLLIPVFVMIRPRGGDFLYSGYEFEIMKRDIEICRKLKVDGVVFGILNDDGSIDKNRTTELVDLSKPLPVTFHRAFDMTNDAMKALEDVIDCGCERILTSGLKSSAIDGADLIAQLIKLASGKIIIIPGGGIRPNNVAALITKITPTEIHSSAKTYRASKMKVIDSEVKMGNSSNDEFGIPTADVQMVRELKAAINSF